MPHDSSLGVSRNDERGSLFHVMSEEESHRVESARLVRRSDESDEPNDDPGYWLDLTRGERVELAWELSREAWNLAHPESPDERGLSRSTAELHKR